MAWNWPIIAFAIIYGVTFALHLVVYAAVLYNRFLILDTITLGPIVDIFLEQNCPPYLEFYISLTYSPHPYLIGSYVVLNILCTYSIN